VKYPSQHAISSGLPVFCPRRTFITLTKFEASIMDANVLSTADSRPATCHKPAVAACCQQSSEGAAASVPPLEYPRASKNPKVH
jgi:hypothetical protein